MKISVLTVEDVPISKWRWWSDWIDIAVFDYSGEGFLLQMRVSRSNSKEFKHIRMRGIGLAHPSVLQVGDLTQMARQ